MTVIYYTDAPRDAAREAAITWAGELALTLNSMDRPQLQAAWQGDAGIAARLALKEKAPAFLAQLTAHMDARLKQLPKAA